MTGPKPPASSSPDPTLEPARFERCIARLLLASAPELARRRQGATMLGQIGGWERPMLLAAAFIGLVAMSTLALSAGPRSDPASESSWVVSAGVPARYAGWVERGEAPPIEASLGLATEGPR